MLLSRAEAVGFGIAVVIVAIMGVIAFAGPFHKVVKTQASGVGGSNVSTLRVKIVTDPNIIGRYVPSSITAHVGQTIVFTNISNAVHTVTAKEQHAFDSRDIQTNGGTWQFVPAATGTFHYYCVYHPGMLGVIKVVA